jgi:hypothetical protein
MEMISADLPPPLPVETAVIAYYESAPANRPVTILFGKDATYSLKLVPNRFEKSRLVCVITTKNKLNAIVWATSGDDHFRMSPAPSGDQIKTAEQSDFLFDACAHLIVTDRQRKEQSK